MESLLGLTLAAPLVSATVCLALVRRPLVQRAAAIGGALVFLGCAAALLGAVRTEGVLASAMGGWPAPFGITLVADHLAAVLVLTAALIGAVGAVYALATLDERRLQGAFLPLLLFLLGAVAGALLTGDVFNLFVWFELMLLASFVLLALGGERVQLEGAIKYVIPSILASALMLCGVALLYRLTGTLNMAHLAGRLSAVEEEPLVTLVALVFLVALSIKAAVFPLFFWLPAAYPAPPIAITAIFSGLLTKVAVYAMVRLFSLLFVHEAELTHSIILVAAGLTMVTGVLGAVAATEVKRLLSFHVVSQIGYMLMGLGLLTASALGAVVYFLVHIMVTKTALFLVMGVVHRERGTYELGELGGLYAARPLLAVLFLVPALSLAGVPPCSGFVGKLALLQAALDVGGYVIAGVAVAVSLLTLFSMNKLWTKAFWGAPPGPERAAPTARGRAAAATAAGVLSLSALALGLAAGPVYEAAQVAGRELMAPHDYVRAALEAGR